VLWAKTACLHEKKTGVQEMAHLQIRDLHKVYGGKVEVLRDVNIEAEKGEFVVLVGPSGCGKSTLLRMIAGLEDITGGEIHIAGRKVNNLLPAERDIAMVFQDYALYPHMSVRENLAFGLRIKKFSEADIETRIAEASRMLNIDHLLERRPAQLSGGQRQRVAIGRAIVRHPEMFLFDEPLSNLDAKLRAQTRIEIAALQRKLGTTAVYVTHDQVEAMTLGHRIVVLNKGKVQQCGAPLDLYNTPVNTFVAGFIGNPAMNFFRGHLDISNGKKIFKFGEISIDFTGAPTPAQSCDCILGIRPEAFRVPVPGGEAAHQAIDLKAQVVIAEPHGHETHLVAEVAGVQIIVRSANPKRVAVMEKAAAGEFVGLNIDRAALHWFEASGDECRLPAQV
jgi:ABC-type sugar transport system ATPase subunit